jgi:predicted AAA+ superfamily ATPase
MTLQEYFNTMLYRDVIERYNIKDSTLFKQFVKILFQSVTKEYSINKISNTLKSKGFSFDKNLIYSFVDYLEDIYF